MSPSGTSISFSDLDSFIGMSGNGDGNVKSGADNDEFTQDALPYNMWKSQAFYPSRNYVLLRLE